MNNGKKFYTIDDITNILGYSPQTVRRLAKQGVIPLVQLSGRKGKWKIPKDQFEKWVNERYAVMSGS